MSELVSACAVERGVGADILGQLGFRDRTCPEADLGTILEMLRIEENPVVLQAVLIALAHFYDARVVVPASLFQSHRDADVRYAVVHALMGQEHPVAIAGLIARSRDSEARTRDWATFALGSQVDLDTPELREALYSKLTDDDEATRDEALRGLAHCKDRRVLSVLIRELSSESVGPLSIEAAGLMAEPALLPPLLALRSSWGDDVVSLNEAIGACTSTSA